MKSATEGEKNTEKIVVKLMLFYERKVNDRMLISSAFMLILLPHYILFMTLFL